MNYLFFKKKPILTKLNLSVEKIHVEAYNPSDLLPPSGII